MPSSEVDFDRLVDTVLDVLGGFTPDEQRLAGALYGQLALGEPVDVEVLAKAHCVSPSDVSALLHGPRLERMVYYDDDRRLIGFGGLAVVPMKHEFEVDGHTLYTWCAWDSLFIPEILGRSARVTSPCPQTGTAIRLTVTPDGVTSVEPPEVVVSFLLPDGDEFKARAENVMAHFCHYIFFLASPQAATAWTAEHPGTFALTLDQAFELGKRKNAAQFADVLAARAAGRAGAMQCGSRLR